MANDKKKYYSGQRIRKIREFKGIDEDSFSELLGIEKKKLLKIENGEIKPKEALINRIAKELGVDIRAISELSAQDPIGVLYILFELEELYGINVDEHNGSILLSFTNDKNNSAINGYLKKWRRFKALFERDLKGGTFKERKRNVEMYNKWKWNFPYGISEIFLNND